MRAQTVASHPLTYPVIPAKAGIQCLSSGAQTPLGPGLRRDDGDGAEMSRAYAAARI